MISSIISRLVILVFGTLYPAYASYKAVKTKNVKEYVKWMMYWIVFALFTCTETITDIFLSWFPFYYEIKIILVIWLLSPATKGSSILYRKFVHPMLSSREQEIDEYISKAKEQSYRQVLDLGQKGVTVLMQTAIKGGGGIVNQLKKSYSLSDLSDPTNDGNDEADDVLVTDPRLVRRRKPGGSPHRSSSASSASVYFSEVDMASRGIIEGGRISEVRSIEDISSGYSSGEGLYSQNPLKLQARDSIASQRTSSLTRARSTRVTRSSVPKKIGANSDVSNDSDENEVFDTNIIFLNDKMKKIDKLPEKPESSSSETEFFDIPESNGFHLHGKTFDNKERTSSNNINSDRYVDTHQKEKNENVKQLKLLKDCSFSSVQPPCSATIGYADDNSKVTACKNDSSLSFNLTKLSTALSSLYPSSVASTSESASSDHVESNIVEEKAFIELDLPSSSAKNVKLKENLSESANLEINYYKPDVLKNIRNVSVDLPIKFTNVSKSSNQSDTTKSTALPGSSYNDIKEFASDSALQGGPARSHTSKNTSYLKEDLPRSTVKDVTDSNCLPGISSPAKSVTNKNSASLNEGLFPQSIVAKTIDASTNFASEGISGHTVTKAEVRRGKYKKKLAPLPPLPPRKENVASPIKATLVLQPGVVRSLSLSAESLNNKEIFLNYSPKARRRSRNRSPASSSSRSSDSNASSKMGQALNKMLQLPKKVSHLNIPGKIKEKRNSWGDFFHAKKLEGSKVQSKSASNLDQSPETEQSKEVVKTIQRTGSQISVRSLSDSPLAHRRLRIIRRYVDNDID